MVWVWPFLLVLRYVPALGLGLAMALATRLESVILSVSAKVLAIRLESVMASAWEKGLVKAMA
jgi:hypothetical protein